MLNSTSINGAAINNFRQNGGGAIIQFAQKITVASASGTVASFSQKVLLNTSASSGKIVSFRQSVQTSGSGKIYTLAQNVMSTTPNFFVRNNYDCHIYINGVLMPKSQICTQVTIKKSEGVATECTFSIIPARGVQSPENYQGQAIFVNLTNSAGKIYRAFTGFIDTPTLDIIEQKIKLTCTDRRQTRINALPSSVVANIGQYSNDIFGTPKDSADELENRLKTVAASFDFDNYGNWQLTPWAPKATPDFTLSDSSIFYAKPDVMYTNRTKTLNTVNITINYKYQRLHQQVCNVTWSGYQNFLSDWFNQGTPSFPQRTSISSAASATGWTLLGNVTFVPLWPAGGYGSVLWQPNTVVNTYVARTAITYLDPPVYNPAAPMVWPDGTKHAIETFVLDPNGKKIYDIGSTTITDTSSPLCRGAQWAAAKKFSQSVTELYTIKMSSPQGVNRFGIIDSHESYTINDPYNTAIWTGDKSVYNSQATPGTALNYTTDNAAYAKGSSQVTIPAGGTGTFYVGNQITISGDPSGMYYTVTATSTPTGGGVLKFAPGLKGAITAGSFNAINLVPTPPNNNANFFINQKALYSHLIAALNVVTLKGQTALRAAHRDVSVNFRRLIWPEIDITHTVATTATAIASKGKVASITHTIDCSSGESYTDVSLKLSRAYATDSQSVYNITVPPYEDISYIGSPTQISLGTHYGVNPDTTVTPAAVTWNGYIGNASVSSAGLGNRRTTYPQSFIVDYPGIPLTLTQDRVVTQNPPGTNNGVHTDAAGYLAGVTSLILSAAGTGQLLQGDSITIAGDSSNQVYVVQNDILDVSVGSVLTISPGLGANLSAATHNITSSPPGNIFTVAIPNDSLTVTF